MANKSKIGGAVIAIVASVVTIFALYEIFNSFPDERLNHFQELIKDLTVHFIAALIVFIVAVLLYKRYVSQFFEEDVNDKLNEVLKENETLKLIVAKLTHFDESFIKTKNTVEIVSKNADKFMSNSFYTYIEKDISFNDIYVKMKAALKKAEKRIYVTSFIDRDPFKIPNPKNQKEYHDELLQKLKTNTNPHVVRIVNIPTVSKKEWVLEIMNQFESEKLTNISLYHLADASLLDEKKPLPLNVQIYDDVVIILNTRCRSDEDITSCKCMYIKDKYIADFMEEYFSSLKQSCKENCIYVNGIIKHEIFDKILTEN